MNHMLQSDEDALVKLWVCANLLSADESLREQVDHVTMENALLRYELSKVRMVQGATDPSSFGSPLGGLGVLGCPAPLDALGGLGGPGTRPASSETDSSESIPSDGRGFIRTVSPSAEVTQSTRRGAWSPDEHERFLDGLRDLGTSQWARIAKEYVKTRTPTQVGSHAQKYLARMQRIAPPKKVS